MPSTSLPAVTKFTQRHKPISRKYIITIGRIHTDVILYAKNTSSPHTIMCNRVNRCVNLYSAWHTSIPRCTTRRDATFLLSNWFHTVCIPAPNLQIADMRFNQVNYSIYSKLCVRINNYTIVCYVHNVCHTKHGMKWLSTIIYNYAGKLLYSSIA